MLWKRLGAPGGAWALLERLGAPGSTWECRWEFLGARESACGRASGRPSSVWVRSWSVWVRLGAPGSAWERLRPLGERLAPGATEERVGAPGALGRAWASLGNIMRLGPPGERLRLPGNVYAFLERLGASGSAWGRLGPLAERLGPSGSAWALLERRWGAHGSVGGADIFYDGSRPRGRRTCAFTGNH